MSKVFIEETTLTNIGAAIREKTGKTDLIAPSTMPSEIRSIQSGGGDIPEEAYYFTDKQKAVFSNNNWYWFIDKYGNKVTTENLTDIESMFENSTKLERVPFVLNMTTTGSPIMSYALRSSNITEAPEITGRIAYLYNTFGYCYYLKTIPESWATTIDWDYLHSQNSFPNCRLAQLFYGCYSLRSIPESVVKQLYNCSTSNSGPMGMFQTCYTLDEIVGLRGPNAVLTSDQFTTVCSTCTRLKRLVFDMDNGQPRVEQWKSQVVDLSNSVGYGMSYQKSFLLNYNSGITADKEVKDDATYQALKDDPDWFTFNMAYSRYNHDSAVETINSLPNCKAYLTSLGAGENTIKFKGVAGANTDGGAIESLTGAEIARAAAKGWTVAFT